MERTSLHYRPSLDPAETGARLARLLVPGPIGDRDLERRIARLEERFRVYAASSPALWAPGLAITRELEGTAELYLPIGELRRALRRLFTLAMRCEPFLPASAAYSAASWPGLLDRLSPLATGANPAPLLRRLMADGEFLTRFLFALFLPRRYGGGFGRYPAQEAFLREWLAVRGPGGGVRCLDAACGSGEGTYGLALLLHGLGYPAAKIEVHGATVEPLELFAAAHGWFPHDPARQEGFRSRIRPLFEEGVAGRIVFRREDLTGGSRDAGGEYDVVLCNGLLGGPLLHERQKLAGTVAGLCARLKPGGLLLAADRFHGGWKRVLPAVALREMLAGNGLEPLAVAEGVAGVKR